MPIHDPIKDMVVRLTASPNISTIMDIVVVDLPPSYRMLLSRNFATSLGGTIQMDLSYTSIPNLKGCLVRILREPKKPIHVEKFSKQGSRLGRIPKYALWMIVIKATMIPLIFWALARFCIRS